MEGRMTCLWVASDQPRAVRGRHLDECADDECRGCQPCPGPHCRVCGKEHAEHACPACLADTRDTLAEIRRLCAGLPTEVIHRGVESEAMNLLAPVADPEQTGHVRASVTVGRLPADWLEAADNELHPLLVLGTWAEAYVEAFDHDEPGRITVDGAASYLDRNLAYAGAEPDVPFEDFARDLRSCRVHIERVLHDGEQRETGAPCMTCRVPLELVRGEREDRWRCPRCKQESTDAQYRFAVMALYRENAEWLSAGEMAIRTGVKAGTVHVWASRKEIAKRTDSGRVVFRVEDVLRRADLIEDGVS
jgi:hypothetical protein